MGGHVIGHYLKNDERELFKKFFFKVLFFESVLFCKFFFCKSFFFVVVVRPTEWNNNIFLIRAFL
jgi:hypothetical protein